MFFCSHTVAGLRVWGLVGLFRAVWAEKKREERQRKGVKCWKGAEKTGMKRKNGYEMTGNGKEKRRKKNGKKVYGGKGIKRRRREKQR